MSSYVVSSVSFFLLLVISLQMDESFGAQTEIRKLKETIKRRSNLEDSDQRSSKIGMQPSETKRCGGRRSFDKMATVNHTGHGQFYLLPEEYSSSLCKPCLSTSTFCYTIRCTTTRICQGSRPCTTTKKCERISGH